MRVEVRTAYRKILYMSHERIDARSMAMHILIADRLRQDPSLIALANEKIARWRLTCSHRGDQNSG